jgi:hypothetical protein
MTGRRGKRAVAGRHRPARRHLVRDPLDESATGEAAKELAELCHLSAGASGRSRGCQFDREEIHERS